VSGTGDTSGAASAGGAPEGRTASREGSTSGGGPASTGGSASTGGFSVGVISDTHGHLYPEVKAALHGVDFIIHAGDVGSPQVLAELRLIAPVTAVRGNCDYDSWALALPVRAELTLAGARLVVGHVGWQVQDWAEAANKATAASAAAAPQVAGAAHSAATGRIDAVIFGHSHQSLLERRSGMLYLNPGSAGPRRFNRPRSVARLVIRAGAPGDVAGRPELEAVIIDLD
jgi:uncharacterized protein